MLNGADLRAHDRGGTRGAIGKDQLAWLKAQLKAAQPHDLVFIAAHQPIGEMDLEDSKETLRSVLEASDNIVAYLYGHNHRHAICGDPDHSKKFWEIETGSVIEFPQEGRMIRLKQLGSKHAFLEVSTFTERLASAGGEYARLVALARRGRSATTAEPTTSPAARTSAPTAETAGTPTLGYSSRLPHQ